MQSPSKTTFTVYTKSGCGHCERVKAVLPADTIYVSCDDVIANDRDAFLERMEEWSQKKHRTFPFVFHKGTFIGGREDTEQYMAFQDTEF